MILTTSQAVLTCLVIAFVTLLTRALPFLLFPASRPTPAYITYLGKVLPYAAMGMLIAYCLKNVTPATYPHALPELIAIVAVALLQMWRHNTLLSIGAGTAFYMVLVQAVFA